MESGGDEKSCSSSLCHSDAMVRSFDVSLVCDREWQGLVRSVEGGGPDAIRGVYISEVNLNR